MTSSSSNTLDWRKTVSVLAVVILALIVFFIGTRQQANTVKKHTLNVAQSGPSKSAKTYTQLMNTPHQANSNMQNALKNYAKRHVSQSPKQANQSAIPASLQARGKRRAYAGAPPTIPHAVNQQSAKNCLSCHQNGFKLGERVAPVMSHDYMSECTQCHVVSQSPSPAPEMGAHLIPLANRFEPLKEPVGGLRAYPGAPPVIPHSTHMRTNCLSCHGALGKPGLRSTHPERSSCTQCHTPSATLDQSPRTLRTP